MTQQIAVKLPDGLLHRIDELVAQGAFDSRSEAVRRGLADLLARKDRAGVDEAFVAGYTTFPETEDELAESRRLAVEAIEDEPWEPWW